MSPPTTGTSLDPNPRLYQAPRGIKSHEVQTSCEVLHARSYSRKGLHLGIFDPYRRLIEPRIWIYASSCRGQWHKTGVWSTLKGTCSFQLVWSYPLELWVGLRSNKGVRSKVWKINMECKYTNLSANKLEDVVFEYSQDSARSINKWPIWVILILLLSFR